MEYYFNIKTSIQLWLAFSVQQILYRTGTRTNLKKIVKMLALKSVKDIFELMGLLMETDQPWRLHHYVKNVLISIPLFTLLYPLCAYFRYNMFNLLNATDAFYVIAATILCLGQYWFLVMQKQPLRNLLLELQALIDQSDCFLLLSVAIKLYQSKK